MSVRLRVAKLEKALRPAFVPPVVEIMLVSPGEDGAQRKVRLWPRSEGEASAAEDGRSTG